MPYVTGSQSWDKKKKSKKKKKQSEKKPFSLKRKRTYNFPNKTSFTQLPKNL